MARVIKSQKDTSEAPKVVVSLPKQVDGGRVIDRDIYKANLLAKQILKDGEQEKKKRLSQSAQKVGLATEEAVARGASEAMGEAAKVAITVFNNRADRYADVESDLRVLVEEIVKRILGAKPKLSKKQYDEVIINAINQLRTHRQLKLQFSMGSLENMIKENGELFNQLKAKQDFVIEEAPNVPSGFIRVVTDVGSALCEEKAVLEALSTVSR